VEERLGVKGRMGFTREQARRKVEPNVPAKSAAGHLQEVTPFSKEAQNMAKDEESIQYAAQLLAQVTPDDLLDYGLIPEFVGRLPVIVTVEPLGHAALLQILTGPRNAVVKQFQHLFALDNVELVFSAEALSIAAALALKYKTGARGLRAIIEEALLDVMYEIPSRKDIHQCIITAAVIRGESKPELYDELGRPIGVSLDKAA
jgi:ATP-dependent Clp protease ATP-binding subunit ClpX